MTGSFKGFLDVFQGSIRVPLRLSVWDFFHGSIRAPLRVSAWDFFQGSMRISSRGPSTGLRLTWRFRGLSGSFKGSIRTPFKGSIWKGF